MITRFHIENFKSLVDFTLPPDDPDVDSGLPPTGRELGGFTCLIGLNGSGKSTLLQAFDFVAHVATGKVTDWLERREWKNGELVSNFGIKTRVISFEIRLRNKAGADITWSARFNTNSNSLKCTTETIISAGNTILDLKDGSLMVTKNDDSKPYKFSKIPFEYEGSVLSTLKLPDAHPGIAETKSEIEHLCSLELLSPQLMRKKARLSQDIGAGGEKLSSFLDQLPFGSKMELFHELRKYYPQLWVWDIKNSRAGWKILRIQESYKGSDLVDASHINDGFLRVIAILAQAYSMHQFLLFDEIENGINPSLVEKLMDFLVGLGKHGEHKKQVVVTTHSPMILNFLDDKVARDSVILLYKTPAGRTQACHYFDQQETRKKLEALGPGEVFVDTDLTKLTDRLSTQTAPKQEE